MEEDKKVLSPEETAQKIDELEGKLNQLTQERDSAIQQRDELQKQINGLRITGLTRQVEPMSKVEPPEEVKFDFDL